MVSVAITVFLRKPEVYQPYLVQTLVREVVVADSNVVEFQIVVRETREMYLLKDFQQLDADLINGFCRKLLIKLVEDFL